MSRRREDSVYTPFVDDYRCSACGIEQCKLWRQYMTAASAVDLLCASCALNDQKIEGVPDINGRRIDSLGEITCMIGDLVPAIPCEDRDTFWGYAYAPAHGWQWWRALPTVVISQTKKESSV